MARSKNYQPEIALNQVMDVFWARGYEATSVSDLTAATGLNRKSLYNEFHSKQALFEKALALYASGARQSWEVSLGQSPLGLENLVAFLESVPGHATPRGCFFAVAATEAPRISAAARGIVKKAFAELEHHFLLNLLAAGPKDAVYTERCSEIAATLIAMLIGIPNQARLTGGEADPIRRTCKWLVRSIQSEVEAAIVRPPGSGRALDSKHPAATGATGTTGAAREHTELDDEEGFLMPADG